MQLQHEGVVLVGTVEKPLVLPLAPIGVDDAVEGEPGAAALLRTLKVLAEADAAAGLDACNQALKLAKQLDEAGELRFR